MSGRTKRWLISGVVLVLMICLWLGFRFQNRFGQPLVFPDGSSVRVVSMTYGTNHECGSALARLVRRLPPFGQKVAKAFFGSEAMAWAGYSVGNEGPCFVLWTKYQPGPGQTPATVMPVVAWLEDGSGFSSGNGYGVVSLTPPFSFGVYQAVPRRDKEIMVRYFGRDRSGTTNLGAIRFENPFWGEFPQWEPETLPTAKRDGELEVTLTALVTGLGSWHHTQEMSDGSLELKLGTKREDGANNSVVVADVHSTTNSNQVWRVNDVVLSDATGNWSDVGMRSDPYYSPDGWYRFQGGLWTTENAWNVGLELCRIRGLEPFELLTFKNVPLGGLDVGNNLGWSSNFAGGNVTLKSLLRRGPDGTNDYTITGRSEVELTASLPTNVWLNLVDVRLNSGHTNMFLPLRSNWSKRSQRLLANSLPNIPLEATSVDLTYSVQTTRWVHFLARPEVGRKTIKLPSTRP